MIASFHPFGSLEEKAQLSLLQFPSQDQQSLPQAHLTPSHYLEQYKIQQQSKSYQG